MTKERTNISIEKGLLKNARKHIPNLSEFIEECLKHYLGLSDGMYPIRNDQEILEAIGKLQAKLYINKQNFNLEESIKNTENFEKDKTWRFLWNDYQTRLIPDKKLLEKSIKELNINADELEEILDWTFENRSEVDTNSWQNVFEAYLKNN